MDFAATGRWRPGACACTLCVLSALGTAALAGTRAEVARNRATSATQHRTPELTPWERAERARDAFEATPEDQRTRAEYTRVMDSFRAIYHQTPQDMHAAESINAVAELLTEQGRGQHDPRILKAAIGQYEFLRTQYPGSSLRVGALLAEGQIEENDLGDSVAARERYELLVTQYPRSSLAEEARAGLASIDRGRSSHATAASESRSPAPHATSLHPASSRAPQELASSIPRAPDSLAARSSSPAEAAHDPYANLPNGTGQVAQEPDSPPASAATRPVAHRKGPPATVTGIRHWSTPSYTRVAIDLGGEVEYEAARVPGPDRIYFDLHGARLAQELVGKSFTVTDDGFLKKIRVAQSSGDLARIVLDVNDVTEYSAFLLPNPYRLIIDIHGGAKPQTASNLASLDSPEKPAVTVPNTRATNGGSGNDVARLSDQPGKVEATSVPTSQPIAAVVKSRSPEPSALAPTGKDQPTPQLQPLPGSAGKSPAPRPDSSLRANSLGDNASAAPPLTASTTSRRGKKIKPSDARVVGDPARPARAATPTADGQTSLVRALGLKIGRIVIDPGHGGHDSGTLGVDGLEEKDVVLDVALRLGKLLHERLGSEVIYTRSDDTFIPLETRTAIANKAQADLFLSIHANSSPDASARGVETYYLNFTQQADALAVAARENAVSDQSIYQLSDLVKKIALKEKIAESREFATDVETSLYGGLQRGNEGLKNRGVKKAPFVVLIGANMPSVLAEISFVTNPRDANQLRDADYRQRVAESLYKGVARYAGGLGGTRPVATLAEQRASGQ